MERPNKRARHNVPIQNHIPNDVVVSVMQKLNLKSVTRFLSLSKALASQIRSPGFVANQLRITQPSDFLFIRVAGKGNRFALYREGKKPAYAVYDFPVKSTENSKFEIVGSCNGVLCVFDSYTGDFYFWNPHPLINKAVKIPTPNTGIEGQGFHFHMLGYDDRTDDYKLLRVNSHARESIAEIYTLIGDRWRIMRNSPPKKYYNCKFSPNSPVYLNRTIQWIANDDRDGFQKSIVSLDFENETFCEFDLPRGLRDAGNDFHDPFVIKNLNGFLGVVGTRRRIGRGESHVWGMKKYGDSESWVKLTEFEFDAPPGRPFNVLGMTSSYDFVIQCGLDYYLDDELIAFGWPYFWGTYMESLGLIDVNRRD